MTKSIRYKITQIQHIVVFELISGKPLVENVGHFPGVSCYSCDNTQEADTLINKLHAAIHKEFAGEWEPQEGEDVLVKDAPMDKPKASPMQFLMTDAKGRHWASASSNIAYPWDEIQPFKKPEIPTGPCEVCYGIEGCEDGVQDKPKGMFDERAQNTIDGIKQEIEELKQELKQAAKEKSVIRLDRETVESTWDGSGNFFSEMKRQMIDQGYDFDWIGGGE